MTLLQGRLLGMVYYLREAVDELLPNSICPLIRHIGARTNMSHARTYPVVSQQERKSLQQRVEDVGLALGLIALAALTSPVSQLSLRPVFGSIPAGINHNATLIISFLLGLYLQAGPRYARPGNIRSWLPFIAALVPLAEHLAFLCSDQLGIVGGVIFADLVSCHALVVSSSFAAAEILDTSALVCLSIALVPFALLETFFASQLPDVITSSRLVKPGDIQLIVSAAYVLLCAPGRIPEVLFWVVLISTYLLNPHGNGPYATKLLNRSLESHDWTLLARRWSSTGYVSVLESRTHQYRVLRCDHSLLGGEWLLNDERRAQGWSRNEPTYSVFSMLEAVRLMETDMPVTDADAKALVIGLGVGTAPKALLQHGIDTTIVEVDPTVHEYATRFFDLPTNHTAILRDAVLWTQQHASLDDFERPQFDYIIHDVFTGGAEPLSLFTTSFLKDLRALLQPDAVAAINYAGDLSMPLTVEVLNTIDLAFDRQCQVYSDDAAREDGSIEQFSNFIVFCRNSPGAVSFRQPQTSDYLGSLSKRSYLLPKPGQRISKTWLHEDTASKVLLPGDIGKWRRAQESSASKHWRIMRTVLPAGVWELY